YPIEFRLVGVFSIVDLFKTLLINIVSRIDANLLNQSGGQFCCIRGEVNICYQRNAVTALMKFFSNAFEVLGFLDTWSGYPNILAASLHHANGLFYRALCVHRIDRCHRLYADRMMCTHRNLADVDFDRLTAAVRYEAVTILLD